jgi:urate oxidase
LVKSLLPFSQDNDALRRVTVEIAESQWNRIDVGGKPHRHSFVKGSDEKRIANIRATRDELNVSSGVEDLLILKTTASAFEGFKKDRLTTSGSRRSNSGNQRQGYLGLW